jgi:hypothetical protein
MELNLDAMPWLQKNGARASASNGAPENTIPEAEVFKFRWDHHGFSTSQHSAVEVRKARPAENPADKEERYVPHWSFTPEKLPNVGTNRIVKHRHAQDMSDVGGKVRTKMEQKIVHEELYQTRAIQTGLRLMQRSPSAPANHRKLLGATGVRQYAGHHGVTYKGPRHSAACLTSVSGLIREMPDDMRIAVFGPNSEKVIDPDLDEPESSIDPELVEFRDDGALLAGLDFNGVTLLGDHQIPYDTPKTWEVHLQSLPAGSGCFIGVIEETPNLDPSVFLMSPNPFRMRKIMMDKRMGCAGVYFWRGEKNALQYALLENFWEPKADNATKEASPRLTDLDMTYPSEAAKVPTEVAQYVRSYDAKRGFEGIY